MHKFAPANHQPSGHTQDLAPQLRIPKSKLTQIEKIAPNSISAKETTSQTGIQLQGSQINYFLATHGCDIEKLWRPNQLARLRTSISSAFDSITKKLPINIKSIVDLLHPKMPFGLCPPQFKLDEIYLNQEKASYSRTITKQPQEIFNGIKEAVLSYLDQKNLQIRFEKGDEAIFICPLTPIFIQVMDRQVTITAYPQSRQDLLYPNQWETAMKLPKWFTITSKIIPYAPIAYKILCIKPLMDFLPNGSTCFNQNGTTYCQLTPATCFIDSDTNDKCCLPDGGIAIIKNNMAYITPNNGKIDRTSLNQETKLTIIK